jgi:hypothetical protein
MVIFRANCNNYNYAIYLPGMSNKFVHVDILLVRLSVKRTWLKSSVKLANSLNVNAMVP